MSQTITISDRLYTDLAQAAQERGFATIEQLLEAWQVWRRASSRSRSTRCVRACLLPMARWQIAWRCSTRIGRADESIGCRQ